MEKIADHSRGQAQRGQYELNVNVQDLLPIPSLLCASSAIRRIGLPAWSLDYLTLVPFAGSWFTSYARVMVSLFAGLGSEQVQLCFCLGTFSIT